MAAKKRPRQGKKGRNLPFRRLLLAAGLLALLAAGALVLFRPRPAWFVEGRYREAWERVLAASPSPLKGAQILPLTAGGVRGNYYGYTIGGGGGEEPVRLHRNLAGTLRSGDGLVLAFNPWLVFRKYTDPPLERERAAGPLGGSGHLLLPGQDPEAIRAWTAQLLQEAPGVFPKEGETWEQAAESLFQSPRFQRGARTYTWAELWTPLLEDSPDNTPVWVYAPLDRLRRLPLHETNVLEAELFPSPEDWTEFGLQADILWARPFGRPLFGGAAQKAVQTWLRSERTGSLAAAALGWVAAHQDAEPYNPASAAARILWLGSSYVWERGSP